MIGTRRSGFVGYKAKSHAPVVDVDRIDHYNVRDFWDPVFTRKGAGIILDPDDFYILASREAVAIPTDQAAEMLAYDTLVGEFRVHYAGFFDPGFGMPETGGTGSRAVLEVRSHEVPLLIEHGQIIERGTHAQLFALGGRYFDLYTRQAGLEANRFLNPGEKGPEADVESGEERKGRREGLGEVARDLLGFTRSSRS